MTETVGNALSRTVSEKVETQKWRVPDVVVVQGQTGLMEWRSADMRLSGDVELLEGGEGFLEHHFDPCTGILPVEDHVSAKIGK